MPLLGAVAGSQDVRIGGLQIPVDLDTETSHLQADVLGQLGVRANPDVEEPRVRGQHLAARQFDTGHRSVLAQNSLHLFLHAHLEAVGEQVFLQLLAEVVVDHERQRMT